jgi:hypothetical protein
MRRESLSFVPSNRVLLTYRNFPYKPWYAIAELVDNSTQSYFEHQMELDAVYAADQSCLEVRIDYDRPGHTLSVVDNAMGMDKDELQRAVLLAMPPTNRNGRSEFGMGMKTSCSWLGRIWSITTTKLGVSEEYKVTIDVDEFANEEDRNTVGVEVRDVPADQHYTIVQVEGVFHEFRARTLAKIKDSLRSMYKYDIRDGKLKLLWDGTSLTPDEREPLVITEDGVTTTWRKDIAFSVNDRPVSGWVCILAEGHRGRANAGFDLLRRGRVVVGRPLGYRPEVIFGDQRNDLINQRLYGELHLDDFPVNHLKDDFLWEEFQEDFDDKLREVSIDYINFARSFRPTKAGNRAVTPEVRATADAAIADELTADEMVEQLEIMAAVPPPEPPEPAVAAAEAEVLRQRSDTVREISVGPYRLRIFHPPTMADTRRYMTHQSPEDNSLDIFINDNHPFVIREIEGPDAYEVYTKMCVYDALAEWMARRIQNIKPETIAHFKDQMLRAPGFEE